MLIHLLAKRCKKGSSVRKISADRKAAFLFFLVVEQAVTIAFKIRVGYLLSKLLAHTFIFLGARKTAGTVSARPFESLLHRSNYRFILVKSDFHYLYSAIRFSRVAFVT